MNILKKTLPFFAMLLALQTAVMAQSSDLSVSLTALPNPLCGGSSQVITVRTTNAGPNDAANCSVSVTIDGVPATGSPVVIASLLSGNFQDDNFIYNFPLPGRHLVIVTVTPGTPADPNLPNNIAIQYVNVQFNGTFTVGPDLPDHFSSIKMAVDTLNQYGVCGPTTIVVDAGHVENNVNIAINATGTAANPISIIAAGTPHPLIQSLPAGSGVIPTGTLYANGDAFFKINGGDYITIDGIDVQEMYTGTTAALRMEYGFMVNRGGINDGTTNLNIRNCKISLNRKCLFSMGIYQSNINGVGATTNPASISGIHSNNNYDQNEISNVYIGIYLRGYNDASPYTLFDHNTGIGTGGGNIITNFGGGNTTVYGIYAIYQDNLAIANDSINGGDSTTSTLYGIFTSTGSNSNVDIYNNRITIRGMGTNTSEYGISNMMGGNGTTNTVHIYNNKVQNCQYMTATSGQFFGIYNNSSVSSLVINNNTINDISSTGTGAITGIDGGSPASLNLYGNTVSNLNKIEPGVIYGIRSSTTAGSVHNNTVNNFEIWLGSTSMYGIYGNNNNLTEDYYENDISLLVNDGDGDTYGIYLTSAPTQRQVRDNFIHLLESNIGSCVGIYTANGNTKIHGNTISSLLTVTDQSAKYCFGIQIFTGNRTYIYNNMISKLEAYYSNAINGIRGIHITSTAADTIGVYYNSIYLDAENTGATFSSTGIYCSTTPLLDLQNNIVINHSEVNGSAYNTAFCRSSSNLATYLNTSNNNCFHAGVPGPKNMIYTDGTNFSQNIVAFKSLVSPRDSVSISSMPPFLSTTGPNYDLHLSTLIPTPCESGGKRVTIPLAITDDFDEDLRFGETGYVGTGTAPDLGADEGNFIPLHYDLSIESFIQPTVQSCFTANESIAVVIRNLADYDLHFGSTPVVITATADDGSNLQSFNTTLISGTLESDSSMQVVITNNLNLMLAGNYTISAYHGWLGDQVQANDTLRMGIISNNPGLTDILAGDTIICKWDSTQLTVVAAAFGGGLSDMEFSRDTNSLIPDPGTISSQITISGAGGLASELISVTIDSLIHTYDGDLDLYLKAPDGSLIELSTDNGSAGTNYIGTVFSMSAATPVTTGAAPFTGTYIPEGNFADFTGGVNGNWTLIVGDDNSGNIGTLYHWSLQVKGPNTITSYSWSPTTGLSSLIIPNPKAAPEITTTYVLNVTDEHGCASLADSITIYVNPSYRDTVNHEICMGDSIFAEGAWQHTSGYYTDNDPTLLGCDSITVWNLIVHPLTDDTISMEICGGDSVFAGGSWQFTSGVYFDHLYSGFGCDSLVTLDLWVHPSYDDTIHPTICTGDSLWAGGAWQTSNGTFIDSYITSYGCDSLTLTYLTVVPPPTVPLGSDTLLCWNFQITLDAGNTGSTYLWSNGDTTQTSLIDSSRYWLGFHNIWVQVHTYCLVTDTIMVSFAPCTGVEEIPLPSVSIYPNPTHDRIFLKSDQELTGFLISVSTIEGKVILNRMADQLENIGGVYEIDLSNQARGTYLISLNNGRNIYSFPVIRE